MLPLHQQPTLDIGSTNGCRSRTYNLTSYCAEPLHYDTMNFMVREVGFTPTLSRPQGTHFLSV